jgi:hypothetical protein
MFSVPDRGLMKRGIQFGLLAAAMVAISGCGGSGSSSSTAPANASLQWTEELLTSASNSTIGPPAIARSLGIVSTAGFDAWAAYDAKAIGTRLGGSLRRPAAERTIANKQKAISYAMYRTLLNLYPAQADRFRAKMVAFGYDPDDASESLTTPQGIGNHVAAKLIEYRRNDGANQSGNYADTTGYVPVNTPDVVNDPSKWQPLRFANGATPGFLAPHWSQVIPFGLSSASEFRTNGGPTYGSPQYLAQLDEIVETTANLTEEQKVIAEYWADGPRTVTPPGHWLLFATEVAKRDQMTLDKSVQLFFMVGNAAMDASIACWDMKRVYNTSRPITAIRANSAGRQVRSFISPTAGFGMVDGSQWLPFQSPNFISPPFPEYASGHSTFSAAGAEVLRRFTGSDYFGYSVTVPANSLTIQAGVPAAPVTLSWPTFKDAADQAGMSRRYGGIHFKAGDLDARACGKKVGERAFETAMDFINGVPGRAFKP